MSESALAGVKVLEYCEMVSGPYCAKLMADLGAEVIKIEKPGIGDEARRKGPFLNDIPHPERSGLFLYLNTSKLGITLNPETESGKRIFTELVRDADILIEDTTPGTMERLRLGYQALSKINPSLIMTSITPYGQTGPYREYKAYYLNLHHMSGQADIAYTIPGAQTESRSSEKYHNVKPVATGYVGDYDAGLNGAVATMAALYQRSLSNNGQHIDISKEESLISLDRLDISLTSGVQPGKVLCGLMPCKDGYIMIVPLQQHQWEALVKLMGNPEWALGENCKDEFARWDNAPELQPLIEEWMLQHTRDEIYHLGQSFRCPVGKVQSAADVFDSPQMKAREFFVEIEHHEAGKLNYPSVGYKLSKTPWQASAAPLLGQHNQEIYSGRLGYTQDELAKLQDSGII